eukprot:TRINITY_DN5508_c0_g1_i1.p1 TRINITY_DN5508_c0_g1~~TRINITY_DN5508_c0_g1_i1.p1  ORF type:complete len:426 (+),score=111.40 TRINITY_DN5508_c0_g1_i1:339-1616(+)
MRVLLQITRRNFPHHGRRFLSCKGAAAFSTQTKEIGAKANSQPLPSSTHNFESRFPGTATGTGCINEVDKLISNHEKVLLIADAAGFEPCGAAKYFTKHSEKVIQKLYSGKALPLEEVEEVYADIVQTPDIDKVTSIIAVGGGTAMDLAKIIAIALTNKSNCVDDILIDHKKGNSFELIFLPTTVGTGSEATSFAVVYKNKVKMSVDHPTIIPQKVILDPKLVESLPEPVVAATVLDALAHATESAWARKTTSESRSYSSESIKLIVSHLEPGTPNRLEAFQLASHLSGKAINISRTTLCHSMSYPMSALFGVPHGIACCLTLSKVAALNFASKEEDLGGLPLSHIQESFELLFAAYGVGSISELTKKITSILETLGVKTSLSDFGILKDDLPSIADKALTKGRSDNNPRKVSPDDVMEILVEVC